jgi:hypothetical protein
VDDSETIAFKVGQQYPFLTLHYDNQNKKLSHSLKFNESIDDFVYKTLSDSACLYTLESLRYAFSRISADNQLCIVTINNEGFLSVKLMHDQKIYLSDSLIMA